MNIGRKLCVQHHFGHCGCQLDFGPVRTGSPNGGGRGSSTTGKEASIKCNIPDHRARHKSFPRACDFISFRLPIVGSSFIYLRLLTNQRWASLKQ